MKTHQVIFPVAALAIAFSAFTAQAQERDGRRGREGQSHGASAQKEGSRSGNVASPRAGQASARSNQNSTSRSAQGYRQGGGSTPAQQSYGSSSGYGNKSASSHSNGYSNRSGYGNDNHGSSNGHGYSNNHGYSDNHGYGNNHGYSNGHAYNNHYAYGYGYPHAYGYHYGHAYSSYYYAPRPLAYYYAPPHYYGPGGYLSLSFGFGSGYLYGAPYSGRVYGDQGAASPSGNQYGDIHLQVNPPDAAVYVDGHYAGVVDDFDGEFQRLAVVAGSHKVEIAPPGGQPQVFDVYVDPSRTVDLSADLLQ